MWIYLQDYSEEKFGIASSQIIGIIASSQILVMFSCLALKLKKEPRAHTDTDRRRTKVPVAC
jgi:hypothetical protein